MDDTTEMAKLRQRSRYAVRAVDESELKFGDEFYRFPVERLMQLAALSEKHRLGFREAITLGLSKLQKEVADDVKDRMRGMLIYNNGNSKDHGGTEYIAVKGNFRNDKFMHRTSKDTRRPSGWVVKGVEEVYDETVLNRADDVHYPPRGDVAKLTARRLVELFSDQSCRLRAFTLAQTNSVGVRF